jgi:predicted nuclease with TOPRIM domain
VVHDNKSASPLPRKDSEEEIAALREKIAEAEERRENLEKERTAFLAELDASRKRCEELEEQAKLLREESAARTKTVENGSLSEDNLKDIVQDVYQRVVDAFMPSDASNSDDSHSTAESFSAGDIVKTIRGILKGIVQERSP